MLGGHPRLHMHFTPNPASWLDMAERFFRGVSTGGAGARCLPRRASRKPSAPIGSLVRRKAKRYTSNAVEAEISGLQPGLAQSPETPDCAERLATAGG